MDKRTKSVTSSSSFIYRVLLSLQHLQGIPQFHNGAKIDEIVTYIKNNSRADGDILNQVKTALSHAICSGYVQRVNETYRLQVSAAKIQRMPCCSTKRDQEISRIQKIFTTNWVSGKSYEDLFRQNNVETTKEIHSRPSNINEQDLIQVTSSKIYQQPEPTPGCSGLNRTTMQYVNQQDLNKAGSSNIQQQGSMHGCSDLGRIKLSNKDEAHRCVPGNKRSYSMSIASESSASSRQKSNTRSRSVSSSSSRSRSRSPVQKNKPQSGPNCCSSLSLNKKRSKRK